MSSSLWALALLLIPFIESTPVSSLNPHHLYPRANPCEPGGTPILYTKEYRADLCPPPNTMDADGNCPANFKKNCIAYCEVRQSFTYAQEEPLDNPYCHGPLTCTVGTNRAKQYTTKWDINNKWLEALGLGITGGWSNAETTTDVRTTSVKLEEGECGYFTFLPILHHSW